MKKILLLFLSVSFLLTGCAQNQEAAKSIINKDIQTFYDNLLLENLDGVMNEISTDSKQYYSLYDEYRKTFQKYKYSYKLNEISFTDIKKDHINVSVSVTISGVDQDDHFDSYNVVQEFIFKPTNNKIWKINSLETKYDFK
jgi:hypothetical protein